ncbi:glutathione synthase/ribosomal protein S6 modification enzyme (glutaminyl transferase) [Methylophaga frappieri]|uniref:Glutathione synthase/ribosomal protein S6 modification enzyme (Glutaminyl transferase) n=1 Tax=Methylophaga frappieri (strain ATCC BAA-2434 / DSM 25690 / JAM7) TaxID=754477 RepID=I1YJE1_METFJ|nr:RimK family protein [Methylophaga frappieri]AFJ03034.1 glutathione synthase/ribosomal protein S6 modification enzyme (glutaminyl transferase) [Methylophaga frappieri]
MSNHLIIVENLGDWAPYFPSAQVVAVDDYLQNPSVISGGRAQIINLCGSLDYLSPGYYCSMVAEARDHRVMPSLRTINDLSRKSLYAFDLGELSNQLDKVIAACGKQSETQFKLTVFFGQCEFKALQKLARQIYEQYPCPILEIAFTHKGHWLISQIRAGALTQLNEHDQDLFANALDAFSHKLWRKPSRRRQYRYDMAILHNPHETMPPSDATALKRFISSGKRIGIDVELITPRDYIRLAEYDALFIRETTAIDNHTYKFARRAESEGLVVVDDPTSIIRCTNKIYLKELLEKHQLPMPESHLLYRNDTTGLQKLCETASFPLVMKIPDGAFSKGVIKVNNADELQTNAAAFFQQSAIILLQEFMFTDYDWRIGVFNNQPIYACQYFMSKGHWQIYNHNSKKGTASGKSTAIPVSEVPEKVLKIATKAAKLVGDGLYGIDIKQSGNRIVIIEVNDNPSIDAGVEDDYLGMALYDDIMREFLRRLEATKAARG